MRALGEWLAVGQDDTVPTDQAAVRERGTLGRSGFRSPLSGERSTTLQTLLWAEGMENRQLQTARPSTIASGNAQFSIPNSRFSI